MTPMLAWHTTERGLWWNGQVQRVERIIRGERTEDGRVPNAVDIRVAENQRRALFKALAETEAQYKRGETVEVTW